MCFRFNRFCSISSQQRSFWFSSPITKLNQRLCALPSCLRPATQKEWPVAAMTHGESEKKNPIEAFIFSRLVEKTRKSTTSHFLFIFLYLRPWTLPGLRWLGITDWCPGPRLPQEWGAFHFRNMCGFFEVAHKLTTLFEMLWRHLTGSCKCMLATACMCQTHFGQFHSLQLSWLFSVWRVGF